MGSGAAWEVDVGVGAGVDTDAAGAGVEGAIGVDGLGAGRIVERKDGWSTGGLEASGDADAVAADDEVEAGFGLGVAELGAFAASTASGLRVVATCAGAVVIGWRLPPAVDRLPVAAAGGGEDVGGGGAAAT